MFSGAGRFLSAVETTVSAHYHYQSIMNGPQRANSHQNQRSRLTSHQSPHQVLHNRSQKERKTTVCLAYMTLTPQAPNGHFDVRIKQEIEKKGCVHIQVLIINKVKNL